MKTKPSTGPLGIIVFSILITAAGAAILIDPRVPVVLLASIACYGALTAGYLRTRRSALLLRAIRSELSEAVDGISGAASEVTAASHSLSERVSTQSASLSEATGTGELMASITRQSAETGRTAEKLVSEAEQLANQSAEGLESLARTLRESNTAAGKIGTITRVVEEIAFQTNILALNAAVEAARAGQAGAGFAVVADEVRNLAQRCAKASQEIADLVEESILKARAGESGMEQLSGTMRALIGHTSQVRAIVDEIAVVGDELVQGTDTMIQGMRQAEELSSGAVEGSEQTAVTNRQLSVRAEAMRDLAERLSRVSV
jgi:methyl-accepting chemotaxis protein